MSEPGSVTQLMNDRSDDAYWALYVRFVTQNEALLRHIRQRLPSDRMADPEDIVGDAFQSVWRKALEGAHRQFDNRDNLLALLTCYAKAKADDARKRKRPLGESSVVGNDSDSPLGAGNARGGNPTDEELRAAYEGIEERLALLESEDHRRIARAAMEGLTQEEIAHTLGFSNVKRVERALDAIRECWTRELVAAFRRAWSSGETPGFERYFAQFRPAGKWLVKTLVEIEIHERLQRNLPVSLADLRQRAGGTEHVEAVERVCEQSLFFDEPPEESLCLALEKKLEPDLLPVVQLKQAGLTNAQIAERLRWPLTSVKDALRHIRQVLEELSGER